MGEAKAFKSRAKPIFYALLSALTSRIQVEFNTYSFLVLAL